MLRSVLSFAFQWLWSAFILILVGALLAESPPRSRSIKPGRHAGDQGPSPANVGKRAVALLLDALERLGLQVAWLRDALIKEQGRGAGKGGQGATRRSLAATSKHNAASKLQADREPRVRLRLKGAILSFGDIRMVDAKYACYRIHVTPRSGQSWEVWRRMADMIKLKASLSKLSAADVDLPQLPHAVRRSFDASHLARRRRRIQRFLQMVMEKPTLRESDAMNDFLSPEVAGAGPPLQGTTSALPRLHSNASMDGRGMMTTPSRGRRVSGVEHSPRTSGVAANASGVHTGGSHGGGGGWGGRGGGGGGVPKARGAGVLVDPPSPAHFRRDDTADYEVAESPRSSEEYDEDEYDERMGYSAHRERRVSAAGAGPPSPPRSPPEASPRNSGIKSMHYMKNAVMTGTRRIARHVPMSMPNPKTIQRHIPLPKGVPKLPAKYNPYKRSTKSRGSPSSNSDYATDATISAIDAFSGAYGGGAVDTSGTAAASSTTTYASGGDCEGADGLSWREIAISSGAGAEDAAGGDSGPISPRRLSNLWKRSLGSKGAGGGGGTSYGYSNGNGSSHGSFTNTTYNGNGGGGGGGRGGGGTGGGVPDPLRRSAVEVLNGLSFDDESIGDHANEQELREGDAFAYSGGGGGGGGGDRGVKIDEDRELEAFKSPRMTQAGTRSLNLDVHLLAGVSDGGRDHLFVTRSQESSASITEIRGSPAACPLVYSELFAAEESGNGAREDHVAAKGHCRRQLRELVASASTGNEDAGTPSLLVLNFQIPGDPCLSLVLAWIVQPEPVEAESAESLRKTLELIHQPGSAPLSPCPSRAELPLSTSDEAHRSEDGVDSRDARENERAAGGTSHSGGATEQHQERWHRGSTAANDKPQSGDRRSARLKLLTRMLDPPLRQAEANPTSTARLGQEATLRYSRGDDYLEIDVDLASVSSETKVASFCRADARSLSLEAGLVLLADPQADLPESVLGVARIEGLQLDASSLQHPLWISP